MKFVKKASVGPVILLSLLGYHAFYAVRKVRSKLAAKRAEARRATIKVRFDELRRERIKEAEIKEAELLATRKADGTLIYGEHPISLVLADHLARRFRDWTSHELASFKREADDTLTFSAVSLSPVADVEFTLDNMAEVLNVEPGCVYSLRCMLMNAVMRPAH